MLLDLDIKAQNQKKKGYNQNKQVLKKYNSIKSAKKSEMDARLQTVNPGGQPGVGDRGHTDMEKGQKVKQIYTKCKTGLGSLGSLASKPGTRSPTYDAGKKDDVVNESNDKFQVSKENLSLNMKQAAPLDQMAEQLKLHLDQPHLLSLADPSSAPFAYDPASATSKTVETTLSQPVAKVPAISLPTKQPDPNDYLYPIHNYYPQKPKTSKNKGVTCKTILESLPQKASKKAEEPIAIETPLYRVK